MEIYGIAIGAISREKVRSMAVYMRYLGVILGIIGGVIELSFLWYFPLSFFSLILGLSVIALIFFALVGYMGLTAGFLSNWIKMAFILFLISGIAMGSFLFLLLLSVPLLVTHIFLPALSVSIFGYGLKEAMDLYKLGLALMLAGGFTFIVRYWGLLPVGVLLFLAGREILKTIPKAGSKEEGK